MGLVREFVGRKACVAVDAVGRLPGGHVIESRLPVTHQADHAVNVGEPQGAQLLVALAVGGEPFAVIIDGELVEKS